MQTIDAAERKIHKLYDDYLIPLHFRSLVALGVNIMAMSMTL